ncbi:hypothetical protein GCM10029963_01440 [Micromonospora andamanensis]|uniref:hypothetical protein n=1 Tax=Micromonospora andamanensis TaxID=1287068 RepID=UPI0019526D7C|nr:hypothetical protein [Micromonospora andamanensis]GIJ41649.1 hypothetical protein Vwe01_49740 [Micromonospora andamanensis]
MLLVTVYRNGLETQLSATFGIPRTQLRDRASAARLGLLVAGEQVWIEGAAVFVRQPEETWSGTTATVSGHAGSTRRSTVNIDIDNGSPGPTRICRRPGAPRLTKIVDALRPIAPMCVRSVPVSWTRSWRHPEAYTADRGVDSVRAGFVGC